jgi:hypothetical protein
MYHLKVALIFLACFVFGVWMFLRRRKGDSETPDDFEKETRNGIFGHDPVSNWDHIETAIDAAMPMRRKLSAYDHEPRQKGVPIILETSYGFCQGKYDPDSVCKGGPWSCYFGGVEVFFKDEDILGWFPIPPREQ